MDLNAMRPLDLDQITALIAYGHPPINVLWQTEDSIAFVARGREGRSEFHVDPSDEVMYMIKGDMNLHYRTPEGGGEGRGHPRGGDPALPGRHPALAALPHRRLRAGARAQAAGGRAGSLPLVLPGVRGAAPRGVAAGGRLSQDPVSEVYAEFYGAGRTARAASAGTSPRGRRRRPAPDQAGAGSAWLPSLAPDCLSNRWHFRKVSHTRSPARTL